MRDDYPARHRRTLMFLSTVSLVLALNDGDLTLAWAGLNVSGPVIWIGLIIAQVYFAFALWASPYRGDDSSSTVKLRPDKPEPGKIKLPSSYSKFRIYSDWVLWEYVPFVLAAAGIGAAGYNLILINS